MKEFFDPAFRPPVAYLGHVGSPVPGGATMKRAYSALWEHLGYSLGSLNLASSEEFCSNPSGGDVVGLWGSCDGLLFTGGGKKWRVVHPGESV